MLSDLNTLQHVKSDRFAICCIVPPSVKPRNCLPKANAFSSCEDLMRNSLLRICLWALGCLATFGNIFVVIWRQLEKGQENRVQNFLIANLGAADFLMGIYLFIIASADVMFRGNYFMHDEKWRNGLLCNVAGILATVSSELSVVTLATIAVDRLIVIVFPFSDYKLTFKSTSVLMLTAWAVFITLAIIPTLPLSYFSGGFYSRAPVCLAFHLTPERSVGMGYSVAIFTVFNFLAFLIIFLCYLIINMFVRKSSTRTGARGGRTSRLAVNTAVIVMTDFCCWVPIMIMSLMALSGIAIPGEKLRNINIVYIRNVHVSFHANSLTFFPAHLRF